MCCYASWQTLQILPFQPIWLSQEEPPSNSVLGAGLKGKLSLTSTQFPRLFLEIANLGQNVILFLSRLKLVRLHCLQSFWQKSAQDNVSKVLGTMWRGSRGQCHMYRRKLSEMIDHGGRPFSCGKPFLTLEIVFHDGVSSLPSLETPIHRDIHKVGAAKGCPSFVEAVGGQPPYGWMSRR